MKREDELLKQLMDMTKDTKAGKIKWEERFEKIVPLAKKYGAALVVGTIDEKGMAVFESAEETYRVSLSAVPPRYINPSSREVVMPRTGGTTGFILVKKEGRNP